MKTGVVRPSNEERQKILVYGVTGMVGSRIRQLLGQKFRIVSPSHSILDVTDLKGVRQNIEDVMPDHIVYAAGLAKVDYAQLNRKEAFGVNYVGARNVAENAASLNIPVCYISTDAVFDGSQSSRPYKEDDKPNPLSVFGESKLAGEKAVLGASSKNFVIRSEMVYSSFFPNKLDFVRVAYDSLKNKNQFAGILDQVINPTFVDDLVWAIATTIEGKAKGVYHVASVDFTTNYVFVEKIAKIFRFRKSLISEIKFNDFFKDKPAPRIRYCWLDTSKFKKEFGGGVLHTIDQGLIEFKRQINKLEVQPIDF